MTVLWHSYIIIHPMCLVGGQSTVYSWLPAAFSNLLPYCCQNTTCIKCKYAILKSDLWSKNKAHNILWDYSLRFTPHVNFLLSRRNNSVLRVYTFLMQSTPCLCKYWYLKALSEDVKCRQTNNRK